MAGRKPSAQTSKTPVQSPIPQARPLPPKAYEDVSFLKGDACRPVRVQLELLKPLVELQDRGVRSTVVVFGSARIPAPGAAPTGRTSSVPQEFADYYAGAQEFARLATAHDVARGTKDFVIITGGGPGIMEAGNRGAWLAGGPSVGLHISLPMEQKVNPFVSEDLTYVFHYFSIRKMHFLMKARAVVAFPGGFGTMDELFETLTLVQTRKIKRMPIILFGTKFWRTLINIDYLAETGMISPNDLDLISWTDDPAEAWDIVRTFTPQAAPARR